MSLKSIDIQLSLSRMRDAGNIQNQLIHKPVDDQVALSIQAQEKIEEQRKKSNQVNKTAEMLVKDPMSQGQQSQSHSHKSKHGANDEDECQPAEHPYKGHRIDISL